MVLKIESPKVSLFCDVCGIEIKTKLKEFIEKDVFLKYRHPTDCIGTIKFSIMLENNSCNIFNEFPDGETHLCENCSSLRSIKINEIEENYKESKQNIITNMKKNIR